MNEESPTNPFGDPEEVVDRFYISETDISPLITKYNQAREEFVEDAATFLEDNSPVTLSEGSEILAEELLDQVFDDLVSRIEDTGISLWVTLADGSGHGMDFPIYQRSPVGVFNSVSPEFHMESKSEPSDAFFEYIALMIEDNSEEEEGTDWGGAPNDVYEKLSEPEQEIVFRVRNALIGATITPEVSLLVEYATEVTDL